jgi:hypothetical protein
VQYLTEKKHILDRQIIIQSIILHFCTQQHTAIIGLLVFISNIHLLEVHTILLAIDYKRLNSFVKSAINETNKNNMFKSLCLIFIAIKTSIMGL